MTEDQLARPPVVTFLGHIDHGKTSLLDKIRQTRVQAGEAAGITQHTRVHQVDWQGQKITLIDTPGHEVFKNMRARGAQVTDLAVLVIAANEGIKPQTRECLEHIQEAGIPYLIAFNKMDLPGANPEEIKNKLTQFGVVVEDRGGEVVAVPVSAETGEGLEELLEMILLVAEMTELEKPSGPFLGVVLESQLDPHRGAVVTIIVKQGQLQEGDVIVSSEKKAKVKALFNDQGERVKTASVSQPVVILGFSDPLPAGSRLSAQGCQPEAQKAIEKETGGEEGVLRLLVKADTQGTREAVLNSLPEEVAVVRSGVGDITDSDVFFASSCEADIVGFRVKAGKSVLELAKREELSVATYQIIYKLIEDLEERIGQAKRVRREKNIVGRAEIIAEFEVPAGRIAGAKVKKGIIKAGASVIIQRDGEKVAETKIASLKSGKEDVQQISRGGEFGALFEPAVDFIIGDMIIYERINEGEK